jgi:hypothetical protein
MRVRDLAQHLNLTELARRPAMVHVDEWRDAKIIKADVENCRVLLFDSEQEEIVPSNQVYPSLPTWRISQLLAHRGRSPLQQIQLSLGHDSILTTERYLGIR